MPRKNSAAVALGRKGGRVNSKAQQAARLRNIAKGGRPKLYNVDRDGLNKLVNGQWRLLEPPYDAAAIAFLRRQQR